MCERRVQAASRKLSSRALRDVQRSRPKGLHDVLMCSDVRVGRASGPKGMVALMAVVVMCTYSRLCSAVQYTV